MTKDKCWFMPQPFTYLYPALSERSGGTNAPEPDYTPSQPALNLLNARCDLCYLAYHLIIKHVVCTKKYSSIKAITHRSLINPSKPKHLSSTPNMALPYLLKSESPFIVAQFYPTLTNHVELNIHPIAHEQWDLATSRFLPKLSMSKHIICDT